MGTLPPLPPQTRTPLLHPLSLLFLLSGDRRGRVRSEVHRTTCADFSSNTIMGGVAVVGTAGGTVAVHDLDTLE